MGGAIGTTKMHFDNLCGAPDTFTYFGQLPDIDEDEMDNNSN